MKAFTVRQAVEACKGKYTGDPALLDERITGVAIDNRIVKDGFLFVPIIGEVHDGHTFIDAAFEAGAVCCLSQRPLGNGKPHILVESTLDAFQAIAGWYRGLFDMKMIGVTGSAGKTTTKELIACALSAAIPTFRSKANLNNQTGVPLNLFALEDCYSAAVIEMGTNHFGEIRSLARMVRPDYCVLTNIGEAHIENFGTKEGTLKAKSEMLEYMSDGGRVFVCGDDPLLKALKQSRSGVISYGLLPDNDYRAVDIAERGTDGVAFTAKSAEREVRVELAVPGTHMVQNALCALAIADTLGIDGDVAARGLASYRPEGGRQQIERVGGITIIDDSYNANPSSMKAAIDVLRGCGGRKVCILGDMKELGEGAGVYHREIGEYAAQSGIDLILCVGELAREIEKGAGGGSGKARWYGAQDELLSELPSIIGEGDTVLVKASRSMELERAVKRLKEVWDGDGRD